MEEFRDGVSGVDDDRVQDVGNTAGPMWALVRVLSRTLLRRSVVTHLPSEQESMKASF